MSNFLFNPGKKFLDPERVLFAAGLAKGQSFADFGSGSGFYTMAAAKIVGEQGVVYSIDILETALDHIAAESRVQGWHNIKTMMCDLEQPESCSQIPAGTVDMVLFANITHQAKNRASLFISAYRLLKTGGKLLVVEWNTQPSPIGPVASARISEQDVAASSKQAAFKTAGSLDVDSYHYGVVFIK